MDSYRRTGIPCGNPKRFQSKEVVRMEDSRSTPINQAKRRDLAGPVENIETEGQRQLKELVHKQLTTDITKQQQFSQHRNFVGGVAYKASTDELSGVSSLSQYQTLGDRDAYIYELKQCGLTDEEITLKLEKDNVSKSQAHRKRNYGVDLSLHTNRLEEIEEKIRRKNDALSKPDKFSNQKVLSRHEMDLERSLVRDDRASKTLSSTLTTEAKRTDHHPHPDDPMNHLPEILASVTKWKQHKSKENDKSNEIFPGIEACFPKERCFYQQEVNTSDGDQTELSVNLDTLKSPSKEICKEEILIKQSTSTTEQSSDASCKNEDRLGLSISIDSRREATPASSSGSNIEDIQPSSSGRERSGRVEWVSEENIIKNRLSLEDIKQIPRFANYSPGQESSVLYLKNLSNKITEDDLVALFIRFQEDNDEEKILFRLLSGRMKGQAFITFPSVEKAVSAMNLINGLNFKGKPIIIQFGRNYK